MTIPLHGLIASRDNLKAARRGYHLELLIAHRKGYTADAIAAALDTETNYIANTLRLHAEGKCKCGAS